MNDAAVLTPGTDLPTRLRAIRCGEHADLVEAVLEAVAKGGGSDNDLYHLVGKLSGAAEQVVARNRREADLDSY
jgi:hypothetical protein